MENIKYIFAVHNDFFKEKGFIQRLKYRLNEISRMYGKEEREAIKSALNVLYVSSYENIKNRNLRLEMHILLQTSAINYARYFKDVKTFQNVLSVLDSEEFKQRLATRHPYHYKFLKSEALFGEFNAILNEKSNYYSLDDIQLLIQAKYYLNSIFVQFKDSKLDLTENQLIDTLHMLSGVLSQLFRWTESFYYLSKISKESEHADGHFNYITSLILSEVKNNTCLDYNGLLLLKMVDCSMLGRKNRTLANEQKDQLKSLEKQTRRFLKKNNIKIADLRKHKPKERELSSKLNLSSYESFAKDRFLFLNEHVFYCNCSNSLLDSLSIETSHNHTKIPWLKPYKIMLRKLKSDFNLVRNEFYFSFTSTSLKGQYYTRKFEPQVHRADYKDSLLLSSFKNCYSILDTIGSVVVSVLEQTGKAARKENFKGEKIYFLNMWDIYQIPESIFIDNPFLISLKTIALDLGNNKFASLSQFKKIRNAIEHNTVILSDEQLDFDFDCLVISRENLEYKTELLLNLTKAAIFSYTYFFRRISKIVERDNLLV